MKGVLKIILFLVIPITISIIWMSGVFTQKVEPGNTALPIKEVQGVIIDEVVHTNYPVGLTVPGTVLSNEEAHVSSKLMASVKEVMVSKGSFVKEGDILVQLDPEQVAAQAKQAQTMIQGVEASLKSMDDSIRVSMVAIDQAQVKVQQADVALKNSETTFQRIKSLYEHGATSKQEYDQAETQYLLSQNNLLEAEVALAQAEASLDLMQSRKGEVQAQLAQAQAGYQTANVSVQDATIRAPFNGMVVETFVDIGDMATPGQPLVTLEKAPYYLEVFVDERKQSEIKMGDELLVTIAALQQEFKGKVMEITPRVDANSRKFRLKITLPDDAKVTSGMFGHALISEGEQEGIFIPQSAITRWSQFTGVYTVNEENITKLRYVQLGQSTGDVVEVLSGIQAGERIVVSPLEQVADNVKVVLAP